MTNNIEDQFDAIADEYIAHSGDPDKGAYEFEINWPSIQRLLPKPPQTVLDYGAGGGSFSKLLQEAGYDVFATDNSVNMVSKMQDQGIKCQVWSYRDKPLKRKFNVVIAKLVVQFIEDIDTFAQVISEVLNKEGKLIISVPHPDRSRSQTTKGSSVYLTEVGTSGLLVSMIHREIDEYVSVFMQAGFMLLEKDAPLEADSVSPRRLNLLFERSA